MNTPFICTSGYLPPVEVVAARVHGAWIDAKRGAGISSRKSEGGEELMVPYSELSEPAKELDRAAVRAVYSAIASTLGQPVIADGELSIEGEAQRRIDMQDLRGAMHPHGAST
jgi:hypothetical protein